MIGYVRVSMAREAMVSPELQRGAVTDWAGRSYRRIVYWIEDLDKTGRHFRRKVARAISGIEGGDAAEIGVWRYDRWGRNAVESLANCKRVELAGGQVVSVTEPYDAETAIGKYNRTNAFALAEMQSDLIGEGWKAVHRRRVNEVRVPAAGTPRFGYVRMGRVPDPARAHVYRRDPGDPVERYVPDPELGAVLEDLYGRYLAGEGPRSLARWLNAQGIPTTHGGKWSHQTVTQVLASGFGAGLLRIHDHDPGCGKATHQCEHVTYVPGGHEPVISPQAWEAFLATYRGRRREPQGNRQTAYPLSGLLFHGGDCGYRLTATYNYGTPGWGYRCPRKGVQNDCGGVFVRRAHAEGVVLEWLAGLAGEIDAVRVDAARTQTARKAGKQVTRWLREETRARNALAKLLADKAMDEAGLGDVYEQAKAGLLARLEDAQRHLRDAQAAHDANAGQFLPIARPLMEEWDTFTPAERREGLGKLIARVDVFKTGYRQPPRIVIVPVWEA